MKSTRILAIAALLTLAIIGCNHADPGVRISGNVSYQDQPIPSGVLTFFPTEGRSINVPITQDGKYAGQLPEGSYKVTVTIGFDVPAGWKEGDPLPPPKTKVPKIYTSRIKTPLRADVSKSAESTIDFVLK